MISKITFFLSLLCLAVGFQTAKAQEATIQKMIYLDGNAGVGIQSKIKVYPDQTFSIFVSTECSTSNILMTDTCPANTGSISRVIEMSFDPQFSGITGQQCMPRDTNYYKSNGATFKFDLPGGGHIYVGYDNNFSLIAERRDAQGQQLWQKHYGGSGADYLKDALMTPSGNVIILSETMSHNGDVPPHQGFMGAWTFCIDTAGSIIWSTVLQGSGGESPVNLLAASNEGCYVAGGTGSQDLDFAGSKGATDLFLARLDSLGNTLWVQTYGGSGSDGTGYIPVNGYYAIMGIDQHIYMTGKTNSIDKQVTDRTDINKSDPLLLKVDTNGNLLWLKTYNASERGRGVFGLSQSAKGNIWIALQISANWGQAGKYHVGGAHLQYIYGGEEDAWIFQTDEDGNFINGVTLGSSSSYEGINAIFALADGSLVVGGRFTRGDGKDRSLNYPLISKQYDTISPGAGGPINGYLAHIGSATSSINTPQLPSMQVDIYPNPLSNTLHIRLHQLKSCQLQIINNLGQTIYQTKTEQKHELNTANWPAGSYTVMLQADGYAQYHYNIVKQD